MIGIAAYAELRRRLGGELTVLCLPKLRELYHPDWVARSPRLPAWQPRFDLVTGFRDTVNWYRTEGWLKAIR
jgi:hypothetical protein